MWNVRIGIIIVVTIKYAAGFLLHQVLANAVQIICSAREVVFIVASDLGASASEYGLEHCSFRCKYTPQADHPSFYYVFNSRGCQFQATQNATKMLKTTLKTYGKLSLLIFLTLY